MNVRYLRQAELELAETIDYYNRAARGLGQRFNDEIERCVVAIAAHPEQYGLRVGRFRRINLHKFPYYLPFVVRGSDLLILAIAHVRRKPFYWARRSPE